MVFVNVDCRTASKKNHGDQCSLFFLNRNISIYKLGDAYITRNMFIGLLLQVLECGDASHQC